MQKVVMMTDILSTTTSSSDTHHYGITKSNLLLPRRITFVAARTTTSFTPPLKYKPINKVIFEEETSSSSSSAAAKSLARDSSSSPSVPSLRVPLKWKKITPVGAGLKNMGNTCFLNATLQCITYTAPLANLMGLNEHGSKCRACGFCIYCHLEKHINNVLSKNKNQSFTPTLTTYLKAVSPTFRPGRQEDAHEFLRFVISGLQSKESAAAAAAAAAVGKNTTTSSNNNQVSDIFSIFGGYLRSEVHCLQCNNKSWTYDQFLDLSLEISNLNALEKCLHHFTAPEILEKRNAYSCLHCNKLTKASKRFTIHNAPSILVIQLKRFALKASYTTLSWEKTKKEVKYPSTLNLTPYLSNDNNKIDGSSNNNSDPPCNYSLYGVLVHSGHAMNCGHYYSIVKAPNNTWYTMDDDRITQSSLPEALRQEAYLLFYVKDSEELVEVRKNTQKQAQPPNSMGKKLVGSDVAEPKEKIQQEQQQTAEREVPVVGGKRKAGNDDGMPSKKQKTETMVSGDLLTNMNGLTHQKVNDCTSEGGSFTPTRMNDVVPPALGDVVSSSALPLSPVKTNGVLSPPSTTLSKAVVDTSSVKKNEIVVPPEVKGPVSGVSNQTVLLPPVSNGVKCFLPESVKDGHHHLQNGKVVGVELVKQLEYLRPEQNLPQWELGDINEQLELNAQKQVQRDYLASRPKPTFKKRDYWDMELDKGRVKKVKLRKEKNLSNSNKFQQILDIQKQAKQ